MNQYSASRAAYFKKERKEVCNSRNSQNSERGNCSFSKSAFININYPKQIKKKARCNKFKENEESYFYMTDFKQLNHENKKGNKKNRKKNKTNSFGINMDIIPSDKIGKFEIVQYLSNYRLQSLMFLRWKKIFNNHLIKSICDISYDSSIIELQDEQMKYKDINQKSVFSSNSTNCTNLVMPDMINNHVNDFNVYIPDDIHDFVNLPDLFPLSEYSDQAVNVQKHIENKKCVSNVKINSNLEDEMDNIIDSMFSEY